MDTIVGLPLHPLIVHLVVVIVPVTALVGVAVSVWPRARTYLGWFPPLLALVALIAVPIASSAGEALEEKVPGTSAIERHAELGDIVILGVGPLFGLMALQWLLDQSVVYRRIPLSDDALVWVRRGTGAAVIVAAIASIWLVVLAGDTGARAVWG
ncbi:MAG: DUF2231 domain-containing protein [Gordonia sp. (in: high G+C Gram-positive bacteria)]|uniref:DUF2231 domain-containing protein n=1 Tax=Gordonia sp. (in: high G+C Gram-positive bacteria) TaxID=84139 RepID=UPI003BB6BAEB